MIQNNVQAKGNQKTILRDCQTRATTAVADEIYQEPKTKARNRLIIVRKQLSTLPRQE